MMKATVTSFPILFRVRRQHRGQRQACLWRRRVEHYRRSLSACRCHLLALEATSAPSPLADARKTIPVLGAQKRRCVCGFVPQQMNGLRAETAGVTDGKASELELSVVKPAAEALPAMRFRANLLLLAGSRIMRPRSIVKWQQPRHPSRKPVSR